MNSNYVDLIINQNNFNIWQISIFVYIFIYIKYRKKITDFNILIESILLENMQIIFKKFKQTLLT